MGFSDDVDDAADYMHVHGKGPKKSPGKREKSQLLLAASRIKNPGNSVLRKTTQLNSKATQKTRNLQRGEKYALHFTNSALDMHTDCEQKDNSQQSPTKASSPSKVIGFSSLETPSKGSILTDGISPIAPPLFTPKAAGNSEAFSPMSFRRDRSDSELSSESTYSDHSVGNNNNLYENKFVPSLAPIISRSTSYQSITATDAPHSSKHASSLMKSFVSLSLEPPSKLTASFSQSFEMNLLSPRSGMLYI